MISSFMNSVSSVVRRFGRRRATVLLFVGLIVGSACRQDMHNQPKYRPLRESAFFGDQLSSRPFVPDTIARGELRDDQLLYTGKIDGNDALRSFEQYRMIIYALLLIIMMIVRPEGLFGVREAWDFFRRRRRA